MKNRIGIPKSELELEVVRELFSRAGASKKENSNCIGRRIVYISFAGDQHEELEFELG